MLFDRGPIASALIGVWKLRQYSDVTQGLAPQHPFGLNPDGLLIYTPDGFMSAVLMAPDRPKLSAMALPMARRPSMQRLAETSLDTPGFTRWTKRGR
jgi:hypothetical protein